MGEMKTEEVIKVRVNGEIRKWLENLTKARQKGNVTNKALEFYHDYHYNRKGFFIRLIDLHYSDMRALLRKIGKIKRSVCDQEGKYWDGN